MQQTNPYALTWRTTAHGDVVAEWPSYPGTTLYRITRAPRGISNLEGISLLDFNGHQFLTPSLAAIYAQSSFDAFCRLIQNSGTKNQELPTLPTL